MAIGPTSDVCYNDTVATMATMWAGIGPARTFPIGDPYLAGEEVRVAVYGGPSLDQSARSRHH